jgi:large repetitive protein
VPGTRLSAGDIAIIGYNTGQNLSTPNTEDKLYFVLLKPIASGTTIHITDRAWNGATFANAAGDGTFTYTAGANLPAGTVVSITPAQLSGAGIDINHTTGDTFYAYQGADANTPTSFLYAAEFAEGNTTFSGSLANTGLSTGASTAIAIQHDSGAYAGPTTHAGSLLFNGAGSTLLASIADPNNWTGDDVDGVNANEQFVQTGPWLTHHNLEFYGVGNPGGSGIFNVVSDSTHSGGIDTFNYSLLYNNALVGGTTPLVFHPNDIVFDTVNGRFFIADSNISDGNNRILMGNIADLNGSPGTIPTLTVLFSDPGTTTATRMDNLVVDTANQIVYFTHGGQLEKVNYNGTGHTMLFNANVSNATSPSGVGNPAGSTNNFYTDMEINFATGHVYLASKRVLISSSGDGVQRNYIYDLSGLTPSSGTNAFQFAAGNSGTARHLPFDIEGGLPSEDFPP